MSAAQPLPVHLQEAQRLLHMGMHLVRLEPFSKQPVGEGWNAPENRAMTIDHNATGYGLPLALNNLCSIDPDHVEFARKGLKALGWDLDELMASGVRTRSTRPNSGGRSTFMTDDRLHWLRFVVATEAGNVTALELRADSANLQDCIPGVRYYDKERNKCTQEYVNGLRLDDAPDLPEEFADWWARMSVDHGYFIEQSAIFQTACGGVKIMQPLPTRVGDRITLPYPSPLRMPFNRAVTVEQVLDRNGYAYARSQHRYSPPSATGKPGVRLIPDKDGLWASNHASDALFGIFDAWVAFVVLEHDYDQKNAEMAARAMGLKEGGSVDLSQFEFKPPAESAANEADAAHPEQAKGVSSIHNPAAAHPLTKFVPFTSDPKPPRMIIPGLMGYGIVSIAGQAGVGKTTAILPLAMIAAGLIGGQLAPRVWRHVVYVTEDVEQAQRIVAGAAGALGIDSKDLGERLHLVEAQRMHPAAVVQVGKSYAKDLTRHVDCTAGMVEVAPLVVFDTKSAVFDIPDENDASLTSEMIAAVKQNFAGLPAWIVGHLAKANFGRAEVGQLSARGSSALEADSNQTAFIVDDNGRRMLVLGKRRFESKWTEVELKSDSREVVGFDEFGDAQTFALRWSIPVPPAMGREEARQAAETARAQAEDTELRTAILNAVETAWLDGKPLNRTAARQNCGKKESKATGVIEVLLSEGWLYEVEVPPRLRRNNRRSHFLVRLTDAERRAFVSDGAIPREKSEVPAAWQKEQIPFVPDTNGEES